MAKRRFRWSTLRAFAGAAVVLLGCSLTYNPVYSQGKGKVPVPPSLPNLNESRLLEDIRSGKAKVTDAAKPAFRKLAQNHAYKLSQNPYDGENIDPKKPNSDNPNTLLADVSRQIRFANAKAPTIAEVAFYAEFAKAFMQETKFVLDNDDRPIVKINAVRMMNEIARIPYAPIADTLIEIINDKQKYHDAYKNHAFQALRTLLKVRNPDNTDRYLIDNLQDPKRLGAIGKSLEDAILGKTCFQRQSVEVVQYIRTNAIAALGAIPEATVKERQSDVLARPALVLYQVMTKNPAIQPPTSPRERFEALLGVLHMSMVDPNLNLDVLAYGMNEVVIDLISVQGEQSGTKVSTIPWRYAGGRLSEALTIATANAKKLKNDREPKYILDLIERLKPVATAWEEAGLTARPEVGPLTDWQNQMKPKNPSLYKDLPNNGGKS